MADEDEQKLLEAAKKLSLGEQTQHKNWKVRSEAFESIKETCDRALGPDDPALAELAPLFVKAVTDSNAAALDKALDALQAFLAKTNEQQAARIGEPACKNMASKDLKQRPGTVKRVGDVFGLFVELEQSDAALNALFAAFSDKTPKAVAAAVEILIQLVSSFGCKVVPAKPILAALPALFAAKQEPIRDGVKRLTVEIAGYIGVDTIKAVLVEKMPDGMRKDVEKLLDDLANAPRKAPERFLRKEQAARLAQPAAATDAGPSGEQGTGPAAAAGPADDEPEGMDAYEFAEPVDVLKQLDKAFWEGLSAAKWQERRDALQRLESITATPKLAPGDFADLLRELKKIVIKDSNVVCVCVSVACIGNFAQGLRQSFASSARAWTPIVFDKLKEKNTIVTNNSITALKAFFRHCIALQDVAEDVIAALDHKNPKVRLETLKLLQAVIETGNKQAAQKAQPLLPSIAKAANNPAPDIREAALNVLVASCLKAGASLPVKAMEQLDDIRKKRLDELIQQAQTGGKPTGAASAPAATAAAASVPAVKPLGPSNTDIASRPPAARSGAGAKRAAVAKSTSAKAPAAAGSSSGPADDDDAGLSAGTLSKDEAESAMIRLFDEGPVSGLKSEQWKLRKEAMEAILTKIEAYDASQADASSSEIIQGIHYLPGWGEKNFQVYAKAYEAIIALVSKTSVMTKKSAFTALSGVVDKLSDGKLKGLGCDVLTALSEAVGPQFVFTQLHKKAAAHKSPKVLTEALAWMTRTMEEFCLPAFNVQLLLGWAKEDLASTQAPVRTAAVTLLATCHKQLGSGLAALVQNDVKPAQWTILEEAFAANPQQQVVPSRQVRGASKPTAKGASRGSAAANGHGIANESSASTVASADDLLPRADISGSITPTLISNLGSAQWKDRNAAVGAVETLLKGAGGRIQPHIAELLSALKARLGDANRNLAARVLLLEADLAKAVGSAFDRVGKQILMASLACIHESKKQHLRQGSHSQQYAEQI